MKNISKDLASLAKFFNASYIGDPACRFESIASVGEANSNDISAIFSPKYKHFLEKSQAAILIVDPDMGVDCKRNALIVANPRLVFAKISHWLHPKEKGPAGLHSTCTVGKGCAIAEDVSCAPYVTIGDRVSIGSGSMIGPGVVIGNDVTIGQDVYLHAGVKCYPNTLIGDDCVVHANTVLGADGFGFVFDEDNKNWLRVSQIGRVCLGRAVEIGSNSTVDCAAFNETILSDGAKLGSQVMVGHNVIVGKHTVIACKSSVGGSTQIGDYCLLGGEVGVSDNLVICDKVTLTGGAKVAKSIQVPGVYSSSLWPLMPHRQWVKFVVAMVRRNKKEREQ